MPENGIRALHTPCFTKTTESKHELGYALNLFKQDFTATALDRVWVGDINYIWTTGR